MHRGKITKGSVSIDERHCAPTAPPTIVRAGVSQVMEGRRVFAELTVEENLRVGAHTVGAKDLASKYERVYTLFPVLADGAASMPATCPAASSRCSRSAGR